MRVVILNAKQFGYHLDTYYYCKHGRDALDIAYLGFEGERPGVELEGVDVKYVSRKGSKFTRFLRWLRATIREARNDYDVIFIGYFPGCSLVRLMNPRKTCVLDIRTGSVASLRPKRVLADWLLRAEAKLFRHVTVISHSLAEKLRLPESKTHVLPLGADPIETHSKSFDRLDLLYVGTFNGRQLERTILGFERFHREFGRNVPLTYTIVGDGLRHERETLSSVISQLKLEGIVKLPGFVHHDHLKPYWERCNVGVSFVPVNDIYDAQPPTKTFEYILAGMPLIATATTENKRVVSPQNGTLIEDTERGFYEGLKEIYLSRQEFRSEEIRRTADDHHWEKIVTGNLCPYLEAVASNRTIAKRTGASVEPSLQSRSTLKRNDFTTL